MSRCALITGGNRGIGRETALQLARQGIDILVAGRDLPACQQVVDEITASGGKASACTVDMAESASIKALLDGIKTDVDILVNNAGIFPDADISVFDVDTDVVRRAMEIHLHGPLLLSRALASKMRERGYGRIVNLSSGYARLSDMSGQLTAYRCSKAALNALTCVLAAEVQGDIKINAVDPGWVRTDMGGESAPRSVQEAAADVVWAATLDNNGPHGKLLQYRKVAAW